MNLTELIGRLLGLEKAVEIGLKDLSWSAPWAHDHPLALVLGCGGLIALSLLFYLR